MNRHMDAFCDIPTDREQAKVAVEATCDSLARALQEEILGIPGLDGRPMIKPGILDEMLGKEFRFRIEVTG